MTLDQLMAFTVSDDHDTQEKLWQELPAFNRHPGTIRRLLTQQHVEAGDEKAQFVGIEAYVAAGGAVLRDLFNEEHEGYLTNPALLDRLATERLEREAEIIRGEGWKWVEIMPDHDYAVLRQFRRVHPVRQPVSDEEQAEIERLTQTHDALDAEYGDDMPDDARAEMEAVCDRLDVLTEGNPVWIPEDVAIAGAIIGIGHGGKLAVERGLVRPEDMPPSEEPRHAGRSSASGTKAPKRDATALPASLVEDLTAQRTAALRAMLLGNADISLVAIVHALALPLFYGSHCRETCLELRVESAVLRDAKNSSATARLDARHDEFRCVLPDAAEDLWDWLLARDMAAHLGLLAFCAACSVNAVVKPHERSDERTSHADRRQWR
jgi:ParB family chromosome partitioning protein